MNQDISVVLSTEDHQELMQTVASKSAARFSLIPSVPTMTSRTTLNGHSEMEQSDADTILKAFEIPTKIEGSKLLSSL